MSIEDYIEARGRRKGGKLVLVHYQGQPDWKKVRCTHCGKMISYIPKQDFQGRLTFPYCKKEFNVPSLDGFNQ